MTTKTVCVIRLGGYGDCIQAANILPELKRQGYHVTFLTMAKGYEVLRHDPHVDAWIVQCENEVKKEGLIAHWAEVATRFDRFINLSESIEGTMLALPGRVNFYWPAEVRRKIMGGNYLEWIAELAGLPYRSEAMFYPTRVEAMRARDYLSLHKHFNISWCLSGSTIDKWSPHQDTVIRMVLDEMPDARIMLCGDASCQPLEAGWEDEPRIRCESGRMPIRDTLSISQQSDCVVGPDTGVMNAVAFEAMGKVIMLSHLTRENLTKHWVNTDALTAEGLACQPCHRLHLNGDFCQQDAKTGASACQQQIPPEHIFNAIKKHYVRWKSRETCDAAIF